MDDGNTRKNLKKGNRGAFSVVYEATSKRSNRKYAVKIIEKKNVGQDMVRLRTEIEILKRVHHPNIIRLKEIIEDSDTLYIITEMFVFSFFSLFPFSISPFERMAGRKQRRKRKD